MSARPRGFRPALEALEAREVPSVTSAYRSSSNNLIIVCNDSNDYVTVNQSGSYIQVKDSSLSTPRTWSFYAPTIVGVYFYGNGGADKLYDYVTKTLTAYGGYGNDYIYGGTGRNYLYGQGDNDTLLGDDLADTLDGGSGNDSLYGYAGVDRMYGQSGNDYLSGGTSDDYLDGGSGFDKYRDVFVNTKWVISYNPQDVAQEASPICTIASAIAAAAKNTDLTSDFRYLGSNNFSVRLVKNGSFNYQTVNFDGTWNDNDLRPSEWRNSNGEKTGQLNGEFWTLLYARAYLQLNGVNWRDTNTANWGTAWQDHTKALYAMTGWTVKTENLSLNESTSTAQWTLNHLLDKDAITIGGTGHAYMVNNVYKSGSTWYFQLYNPWGFDAVHSAVKSTLSWSGGGKNDGFITISWSEICQNFKYIKVADG
jgi:Ca2+-binding RTX toxin-like protein